LAALPACGEETTGGSDSGESSEKTSTKDKSSSEDAGCGIKATGDCTPHVGPNGKVRVDALIYRVLSVDTAKTVGNQYTQEKADGTFVIVNLRVRSVKDESATLTDNTIKLSIPDGPEYSADSEGSIAVLLSGSGQAEEPFFLRDIQPDTSTTGKIVFDVPKKALRQKPELRFNELGFGDPHGYIRLPSLSPGV
jgi:hypothetical protein